MLDKRILLLKLISNRRGTPASIQTPFKDTLTNLDSSEPERPQRACMASNFKHMPLQGNMIVAIQESRVISNRVQMMSHEVVQVYRRCSHFVPTPKRVAACQMRRAVPLKPYLVHCWFHNFFPYTDSSSDERND